MERRAGEGARPGWPPGLDAVWLTMPFVALLMRVGLKPAPPQDYWWPMVQGRAIAEGGARLTTNTFVYTVDAGAAFFNQPWLAGWSMYQAHAAWGDAGLTWLHAALVVATFGAGLVAALRRGADPRVAAVVCSGAAVFGSLNMTIRTQMFAYPCFAAVCLAAMALSERTWSWRWVAGAVVAAAAWANVHGTFPLATLLMGAGAAGWAWERRAEGIDGAGLARWAVAIGAVAAAGCAHPSGPANYAYVITLMRTVDGSTVTEWAAMPWDEAGGALFYVAALASAALAWRLRARAGASLMMLGCCALALQSQRSVIWWAWLVVPTLAPAWRPRRAEDAPARPGALEGGINAALVVGLIGGALAALPPGPVARALVSTRGEEPGDVAHPPPRMTLSREHAPELLDALARRGHPGRIFHAQALGGEVEWRLARPGAEQVAFVDQRFEMIPQEVWDEYFAIGAAGPGWRASLERWGVGTVVVSAVEMPALRAALEGDAGWRRVERSWPYVVFMREGAEGAWEARE